MISAVILAAGESTRMGKIKPLIKIGNKTFLQHITEQLRQAGISDITVVLGYQADEVHEKCGVQDVSFIVNEDYKNGQFSSLQCGVRDLDTACEAAIVCLGDQPHIQAAWIRELVDAWHKSQALVTVPKHRGKRGHPVIYARGLFAEILDMSPTETAHALTKNHPGDICGVEIEERGILLDADTPDDLNHLRSRLEP